MVATGGSWDNLRKTAVKNYGFSEHSKLRLPVCIRRME
jgi:hypothetical protein